MAAQALRGEHGLHLFREVDGGMSRRRQCEKRREQTPKKWDGCHRLTGKLHPWPKTPSNS
jgi:hypothetical protein